MGAQNHGNVKCFYDSRFFSPKFFVKCFVCVFCHMKYVVFWGWGEYNIGMNSERTQIARKGLTAPMRYLRDNGWMPNNANFVLHHGVGKAKADTDLLREHCLLTFQYDPNVPGIDSDEVLMPYEYDNIYSVYVFNTLPPDVRERAFKKMIDCLADVRGNNAYIAVRTDKVDGVVSEDGVVTKRGTFQTQLNRDDWLVWFSTRAGVGFISTVLTSKPGYAIIKIRRLEQL
jgi:hypothetical protein